MIKYIFKRILSLIPVVFIISVLIFGILKIMPGDPVRAMVPLTIKDPVEYQRTYDMYKEKLGLNQPLPVQYVRWVENTLKGDFGQSTNYNRPVKDVIATPLKNSIVINFFSIILGFLIAIPIGIKSAVKRGSMFDNFWQVFSLIGMSVPVFFIGLCLIYLVALKLQILPAGGMPLSGGESGLAYYLSWGKYMILPVLTLTIGSLAGTIRYVRNAMIEVLSKDYIRTARSKGLSQKVIIYTHAFKNALIPVVTLVAGSIVGLFGGSAITETIFAWNGIGYVLVKALNSRDYMIVLTLLMFYAVLSLIANLIMDIGYALVDPRVKLD